MGPIPISATYVSLTQRIFVTFDQPLVAGMLNTANWAAVVGNVIRIMTVASASGAVVQLNTTAGGPSPDPDNVDYSAAAPVRVVSLGTGLDADPFADFPIV